MKVLTVKTLETLSPDIQKDIHYTLKMEHHTDYVFKDYEHSQYSATISMKDTSGPVAIIIENSSLVPGYTFEIDDLDMEANKIERITVKNGVVLKRKSGTWEWDGDS